MAIEIQTTQNVILNLREAGLGPRILARLLDWLIIFTWVMGCLGIMGTLIYSEEAIIVMVVITILPIIFYDLLFEWLNGGQTVGKKALKIKVVNLDGTTPSFGSYLIRWLFRLVDFTFTGNVLAVVMVAFTDKSQRLGDLLAGTTVVNLKPETNSHVLNIPDFDLQDKYVVTYPNLLDKLSDRDIDTVRSVLNDRRYNDDSYTQEHLVNKIKQVTGYTFSGSDKEFLKKIIEDYNYLSMQ